MNWAWASSLDHIWRSPSFPMWLTLAAAGFFAILMLITMVRAVGDGSVSPQHRDQRDQRKEAGRRRRQPHRK